MSEYYDSRNRKNQTSKRTSKEFFKSKGWNYATCDECGGSVHSVSRWIHRGVISCTSTGGLQVQCFSTNKKDRHYSKRQKEVFCAQCAFVHIPSVRAVVKYYAQPRFDDPQYLIGRENHTAYDSEDEVRNPSEYDQRKPFKFEVEESDETLQKKKKKGPVQRRRSKSQSRSRSRSRSIEKCRPSEVQQLPKKSRKYIRIPETRPLRYSKEEDKKSKSASRHSSIHSRRNKQTKGGGNLTPRVLSDVMNKKKYGDFL